MEFHNYVNMVIALVRPKDIMEYARGGTTSKTTLRTSLVLIWFENSPHSNQSFGRTIALATGLKDQLMKISSFFNTHTQKISLRDELRRTNFYLPTHQLVVWLNQLAQGYPTQILGEWVVWRKTQHDHELNIAVRWQPGNTSEKIFGTSRTTDMLLSSRTILLFRARRYDQQSKGLNNPNSLIEECTGSKD